MKKTIAFVTSGLAFNGNSIYTKSLGGSESAMVYMANELSKLGNEVTVYCECDDPDIYDGVDYRHCHTFMKDNKAQFDVVIVSRFTHFLSQNIDSKLNILWIHDTGIMDPELSMSVTDCVFCLSEFQKSIFADRYKLEVDHFWTTKNGFDDGDYFKRIPFNDKKDHYVYASRPERGLNKLLTDIWPRILKMNHNATLHICGYRNPSAEDEKSYLYQYYEKTKEILKNSFNVIDHGELTKQDYQSLLQTCAYMVYPCNFPEISCINAIEAQANECLVITSNAFALPETIKTSTLVDIPQLTNSWDEDLDRLLEDEKFDNNFMNIVEKFQDEKLYRKEVEKGRRKIQSYSWEKIAKTWDEKIDSIFLERHAKYKDQILNQLVYMSDLVACRELSNDEKYVNLVEKSLRDNIIDDTYESRDDLGKFYSDRITVIGNILKSSIPVLDYDVRVLDVGAHDGEIAYQLLNKYHYYIGKYYALDRCKEALNTIDNVLVPKYDQVETIHCSISDIQDIDVDANFIIVGELLEHIVDTVGFLNNLCSILKRKSVLVFTTPSGPWDTMVKDKPKIEHLHHFELNDIRKIFQDTDLQIISPNTKIMSRRGDTLGHWVYYFTFDPHHVPTFHKLDYHDKFIKTRPYKSISGCMIVKNEENNLHRCLKSIYGIIDELIIVDTGSTDSTKSIAEKYTDKIYDYKWEEEDGLGNFSAARNYAIRKCSGDYILWMDADEELIHGSLLPKFITSDYYNSILVHQKHCIVYGDNGTYDPPYHDRLFKNNGIYFIGVVHEYPTTDEGWIKKGLFQDMVFIAHYGTINRPVRDEKIVDRYYELIVKNYKQRPDFTMAQYYYMGVLCAITSKTGDLSKLEEIFDLWFNKLVPTNDLWLLSKGSVFIQDLYATLYNNDVKNLPVGTLRELHFKNENDQTALVYATSEQECQLFLDIISKKELGPSR